MTAWPVLPAPPRPRYPSSLVACCLEKNIGARSCSLAMGADRAQRASSPDGSSDVVVKGRFRIRDISPPASDAGTDTAGAKSTAGKPISLVVDTKQKANVPASTAAKDTMPRKSSYGSSVISVDTFTSPIGSPQVSFFFLLSPKLPSEYAIDRFVYAWDSW